MESSVESIENVEFAFKMSNLSALISQKIKFFKMQMDEI